MQRFISLAKWDSEFDAGLGHLGSLSIFRYKYGLVRGV